MGVAVNCTVPEITVEIVDGVKLTLLRTGDTASARLAVNPTIETATNKEVSPNDLMIFFI